MSWSVSLLIVTWLQTDKGALWQRRLLHYRQVSIRHKHGPQMLSGPEKTNKQNDKSFSSEKHKNTINEGSG